MSRKVKTQLVIEGQNKAQPAFDQAGQQLNSFTSQAKAAGSVLAGVFSVGALATWVKESALATAQMGKLAQLSGASAEEFQGWAFAAKSVGIEQDKLGDIFKDVQDKVGDFLQTGGGTLADFFENIAPKVGVTAEQFRNLSGPEALGLYVSSLEKANLSQSEMVFYMESIANDATLLLPLLEGNAAGYLALRKEAEELGLVLSGQQVRDAEQFRDSLQTLGAVSEGAGRQISAELLPTMNTMTGLMAEVSRETEFTSTAASILSFGLKGLASVAIIVGVSFSNAGKFIGGAAAAAVSAAKGDFSQARDIIKDVVTDVEKSTKQAAEQIKGVFSGAYEKAGAGAAKVGRDLLLVNQGLADSTKAATDKMKASYTELSKVAKAEISKLTAAQREANSELARLQQQRLDIDERYNKLRANLSGGNADPSYGQAQALKVAARNALQAGDLEGARVQAQAAAKVLEDLASAGENTFGLQGFANELQAIEAEANGIEQSNADAKLKAITAELENLKGLADVKITVDMTPEELANAQGKMQALGQLLSKSLVITPTINLPQPGEADADGYVFVPNNPPVPQFATGGPVRGPGTGTSDSIPALLSNGEYVIRAAAVRKLGKGYLDLINNGIPLRRFADGGMVESVASMPIGPSFPDLGSLSINMGGENVNVYASPGEALNLQRLARKFGRT